MNGSATMLPDDSSIVTKAQPVKVQSSVTSKFVFGMKGFFGGNSRSISWSEFVRDYLGRGRVERLEVGHDGWARVLLKHKGKQKSTKESLELEQTKSSWFSLSAINNFRLPSILSWEFDDVSSVGSSHISDSESVEDDNNPHISPTSSHQKPLEPVIDEDCAKVFLQIGRPSYLERNLKLARPMGVATFKFPKKDKSHGTCQF